MMLMIMKVSFALCSCFSVIFVVGYSELLFLVASERQFQEKEKEKRKTTNTSPKITFITNNNQRISIWTKILPSVEAQYDDSNIFHSEEDKQ